MSIGRMLITLGVVLIILGVLFSWAPLRLGRLPGDITVRGKNTTFYFPLVTCILLSIVLSLIMWIVRR